MGLPTKTQEDEPTPGENGIGESLLRFCRLLRKNNISAGVASVLSAAQGLKWLDPLDLHGFKVLLQSTLVSSADQLDMFSRLFEEFWLRRKGQEARAKREGDWSDAISFQAASGDGETKGLEPSRPRRKGILYSPHNRTGRQEQCPEVGRPSKRWQLAAQALLRASTTTLGRRMAPSLKGWRFSLRRTMRRNLQYGGDLIYLQLLDLRPKRQRVLFLCDVSGSMDEYAMEALEFAYALRKIETRTEVFLFSTELLRLTPIMRAQPLEALCKKIPSVMPQWNAGTRIGSCLRALRQGFGSSLLAKRPTTIILSDGWDQGETDLLQKEIRYLGVHSRILIWLNPYLNTPGYEPTCRGMRAALPYIELLLPFGSPEDLLRAIGSNSCVSATKM